MDKIVLVVAELFFVFFIVVNTFATNKSIDRLERKLDELDTEVFNKLIDKDIKKIEESELKITRKKRVRKPRQVKEIS